VGWFNNLTKSLGNGISNIFAPITGAAQQTIASIANSQLGTSIGSGLVASTGGGLGGILSQLFGQGNTGIAGGVPSNYSNASTTDWKQLGIIALVISVGGYLIYKLIKSFK